MPKLKNSHALADAAIEGQADRVRNLLAKGADPNSLHQHWTALSCAVLSENLDIVRMLLDAGADPNAPDPEEGTVPLMHVPMVELAAARTWERPKPGRSKASDILHLLVSRGADPNGRDEKGRTVLMRYASLIMLPVSLPRLLIDSGADIHAVDRRGLTARVYAQESHQTELEQLLAERGAGESGSQHVALMKAAVDGDLGALDAALKRGADPNFWDSDGNVLYWACASGKAELVQRLLDAGADATAFAPTGSAPLAAAVSSGNATIVKMLLERGATVRKEDESEHTLVELAGDRGFADTVAVLGGDATRIGIAHKRGIASMDITEVAVLVKSDSAGVAEALAEAKRLAILKDVRGKTIEATDPSFVVYQLAGHPWSVVESLCARLSEDDAAALAKRMGCKTIFVAVSDTADSVEYALYDAHQKLEQLWYWGESDDTPKFTSQLRSVKPKTIEDPFTFSSDFLKAQDAFLPGWSERARNAPAGKKVRLDPFDPSECPNVHAVVAHR